MSATIYWRPVKDGRHIPMDGKNAFIEALQSRFGSSPWRLTLMTDADWVRGCIAVSKHDGFVRVLALLEQDEEIEVWAEY